MLRARVERRKKDIYWKDRAFRKVLQFASIGLLVLLISFGVFLYRGADAVFAKEGLGFITGSVWDPVAENFGVLPVIYGTLMTSLLALLIAAPTAIAVAIGLNEILPRKLGSMLGILIELLAAIPSVVYGLWGVFVLVPWVRTHVGGYGIGLFTASLILSLMILPGITSICREVFSSVPKSQREAALALGCTRWEMIKVAIIHSSWSGIFGAIILGLGRALGETMAVTMLIGNRAEITASLLSPAQTMASVIANEYAEAVSAMHSSALMGVGFVLFCITLLSNLFARALIRSRKPGGAPA